MRKAQIFLLLVACVAVCAGIFLASQAWVCDDAFISFRYAQNLLAGHGLCFNPALVAAGEAPVEGYTNFLWTVLVAAGMASGFDPVAFSSYAGIGFFAGTLAILIAVSGRLGNRWLFVAPMVFALHPHATQFATGGLETSMFIFLVTAGLVALIGAAGPKRHAFAGLLWILAVMTRPDGALFYVVGGAVVLMTGPGSTRVRRLLAYAAPFLLVYVPYYIWRYSYYELPLPNTFYTKVAGEPYFGQGLLYVGTYFHVYPLVAAGFVAALLALARGFCEPDADAWTGPRAPMLIVLTTGVYVAYVTWVGGDFMFSRFLLPITPALCLGLQLLGTRIRIGELRILASACVVLASITGVFFWTTDLATARFALHGASVLIGAGAVLVMSWQWRQASETVAPVLLGSLCVLLPVLNLVVPPPVDDKDRLHFQKWNIAEEKAHYPDWFVVASRVLGQQVAARTEGVDLCVAIGGKQVMFAYYGEFATVIELFGLCDRFIASQKVESRGKPGHEKFMSLGHPYLKRRRVQMAFHPSLSDHLTFPGDRIGARRHVEIDVEGIPNLPRAKLTMLRYDKRVMDELRGRQGVHFEPFDDWLDGYLKGLRDKPKDEVRKDLEAFRDFYFDLNEDPIRLRKLENYVGT